MATERIKMEQSEIGEKLRNLIVEKYGSIPKFVASEDGVKLEANKVQRFLYNHAGNRNFKAIVPILAFFGIKVETKVTRLVEHYVTITEGSNSDKVKKCPKKHLNKAK